MYDAASTLIEAGISKRPYAGVVIRHAIGKDVLNALLDIEADTDTTYINKRRAFNALAFLPPINAAVYEHGSQLPYGASQEVQPLTHTTTVKLREEAPHYYQGQNSQLGTPTDGPLTLALQLAGETEYNLSVNPIDFTDEKDVRKLERINFGLRRLHQVVLEPRDLLIITNYPPTMLSSETNGPTRLTVEYGSKLEAPSKPGLE